MQFLIDIALTIIYICVFLLFWAWAWNFWILYIRQKYVNKIDWVLLEIKLPREIMKSPLAMEIALASLLQGGGIGPRWYKQLVLGNLPAWASLEIASLEGIIHFYVRVQKKFRPVTESNLYAQYPGIEIVEADDYTKLIRYHHLSKDVRIWGINFFTSKKWKPTNPETGEPYMKDGKAYEMKADFLPIKTYVDYALEKDPKEEFKVDPITSMLEFMGSIRKGEYVWYQILVQDEKVYNGSDKIHKFYLNEVTGKRYSLSDLADERKQQIRTAGYNVKGETSKNEFGEVKMVDGKPGADGKPTKVEARFTKTKPVMKEEIKLTSEEKDEIEAINKKIAKPLAVVLVRLIYVAKSENFNQANIQDTLSFMKPVTGRWNLFAPSPTDPYDYPWQDIGKKRVPWRGEEEFSEYVKREGLYPFIDDENSNDFSSLQAFEDRTFYTSSMRTRKLFHYIFKSIFKPFRTVNPTGVSILNMEELATIWHFPGSTASIPTLPRIDSTKGVAPVNLPQ